MLSIAGGAIGLVVGLLGIRALLSVNTAGLPRLGDGGVLVGLDRTVLPFTVVVSIATGVLFGLIPALQIARTDLSATLKDSTGRSGATLRHNKARSALVVVEATSRRSESRSTADAASPTATTRRRPRWWSSTRRWPGSSGRTRTR
jgi:hypothetical protein